MTDMNRESAREALSAASTAYQKSNPGFSPTWTGFVAICAASAFLPLFRMILPHTALHEAYALTPLIWTLAGFLMIGLGVRTMAKGGGMRGLQSRWGVMMGLWGLFFLITYLLAPKDYTTANPVLWFIIIPVAWAAFACIGIFWEVLSLEKQENQINE